MGKNFDTAFQQMAQTSGKTGAAIIKQELVHHTRFPNKSVFGINTQLRKTKFSLTFNKI